MFQETSKIGKYSSNRIG